MGTRMKCRVGGKKERMHGTKDTLIRNCGENEMGIKVKGSRNDNGGCGKKDGTLSKGKKK